MGIDKIQASHTKNNKIAKDAILASIDTLLQSCRQWKIDDEYSVLVELTERPSTIVCNSINGEKDIRINSMSEFKALLKFTLCHRLVDSITRTQHVIIAPVFVRNGAKERWGLNATWALSFKQNYLIKCGYDFQCSSIREYHKIIAKTDSYIPILLFIKAVNGETAETIWKYDLRLKDIRPKVPSDALFEVHCGEINNNYFKELMSKISKRLYDRVMEGKVQ